MTDIRDRADAWLTQVNAWHPDVRVEVEPVCARYVKCEVSDCATFGDIFYARVEGGGHGHLTPYEIPHERIVIRLPAQPVEDQG